MKKIVIIFTIALLAVGTLSAQVRGGRRGNPESVKIEGTLQLHNGQFAVASGNNIYYVPRIGRYVGFIDSLKEGANVLFEGYVFGNFLQPVKMTISGKTYDLAGGGGPGRNNDFNNRGPNGFGPGSGGFGPGCCDLGFGGNGRNRPRDNFWGRR
jgi:hypothetical protein